MAEQRQQQRRRTFIVEKPLQYSIILTVLGSVFLVGLILAATHLVLPAEEAFSTLTGEGVRQMIIQLLGGFFGLTFVTVGVIVVLLSHRIAGPVMVFERAIRAFIKGEYGIRVQVRKRDYLQNISSALSDLRDHLRAQDTARVTLLRELDQALGTGDVAAARRILARQQAAEAASTPAPPREPVASP